MGFGLLKKLTGREKDSNDTLRKNLDDTSSGFNGIAFNGFFRDVVDKSIEGFPKYISWLEGDKVVYKFDRDLTERERGYLNHVFEEKDINGWGFKRNY